MLEVDKIKVVVDTNVVISSAISVDGNPAKIFKMVLLETIKNYTTTGILEEIRDVLNRPKIARRLSLVERNFIINNFGRFSEKIEPNLEFFEIKEDPDDNKFLECAVSAAVDYIISGDEHLLNVGEFRGIKIVNPADFIRLFDEQTKPD